MNCVMKICAGEWQELINPSPEKIEQAIDDLIPVKDHFVILEPEISVKNCEFIQTLITRDNSAEIKYLIETRFEWGEAFKQYEYYTTDIVELKKMFRMFVFGIIPDITNWKDITADIMGDGNDET